MRRTHKRCASCGVTKPAEDFHRSTKDGLQSRCKSCAQKTQAAWRAANLEHARAHDIARGRSPERQRAKRADHARRYAANRDYVLARTKDYARRHPEKCSAYHDSWRRRNLAVVAEFTRRYHAAKIQAYPTWADPEAIREVYREAQRITRATGVPYHVDHRVPLNSRRVCGLHNEFNLQILPGATNAAKGNRYWPDMPENLIGE